MAATVRIAGATATLDGWEWTGEDGPMVDALNANLPQWGPSGADPNPELTEATRIAKMFGGEVVRWDEVEHVPDRVY